MKKLLLVFSVMIFIVANIGLSQDIINEMGKDGKFIVRDNEQKEAMVIEDGNVGITGELSVENMPEGNNSSPNVVWDPEDKKFKIVERIFSELSPLSEPLETKSWHSFENTGVDEDGNEISASVQDIEAVLWNKFNTDYGYIKLGPAAPTSAHIYTDVDKFVFNKPLYATTGEFGGLASADLIFKTGAQTRLQFVNSTGFVGIGTETPEAKLHVAGNMRLDGAFEDKDGQVGTSGQILSSTATGTNWIAAPSGDNLGNHIATQDLHMTLNYDIALNNGWLSGDGQDEGIHVNSAGDVGIGTFSPDERLHIVGDMRLTGGFEDKDGQDGIAGQILSSTGTQTNWIDAPSGGSSLWTESGSNIYRSSGAVGIGTSSPTHLLEVYGSEPSGYGVGHFQNTITSSDGYGVYGGCANTDYYGIGGYFVGGYIGVEGKVEPTGTGIYDGGYLYANTSNNGSGELRGVHGRARDGNENYGVYGEGWNGNTCYGVYGAASTGSVSNYGVYGYSSASSGRGVRASAGGTNGIGIWSYGTQFAGYFVGNVNVTGTLSKSAGSFKIDHPLDPENKYLSHSFVESPDMMNVYNGNIVTNSEGISYVELPNYFEALNKDFRYQLTVIGEFADAIIENEISENVFVIRTNKPNIKVSWQITGIRKDAYAEENRIKVEEYKTIDDRGKYLHPEELGYSAETGINYEDHQEAAIRKQQEQIKMQNSDNKKGIGFK